MILSAAGSAADGAQRGDGGPDRGGTRARHPQHPGAPVVDRRSGPYAFQELGFDQAVENCIPVWRRRYGFEVMATIERERCRRTWRATCSGSSRRRWRTRPHAEADAVSINLRTTGSHGLRVADNGRGFETSEPLNRPDPGHLGLASMRERAELLDGLLDIASRARHPGAREGPALTAGVLSDPGRVRRALAIAVNAAALVPPRRAQAADCVTDPVTAPKRALAA